MKIGAQTARCSLSDSESHGRESARDCWCTLANRDVVMCEPRGIVMTMVVVL